MMASYVPVKSIIQKDEEWREWVRQAAEDMRISKKARGYWRAELKKLECPRR